MQPLKVIYTDVDGTLFGPQGGFFRSPQGGFTLDAAKSLIALLERGIDIVPVSGRSLEQLLEDCRVLGLNNFITELGSEIVYDLGRKIVPIIRRKEKGERIRDMGRGTGDNSSRVTRPPSPTIYGLITSSGVPEMLLDSYGDRLEYHDPWHTGRRYTHLFRGEVDTVEVNGMLNERDHSWLKLVDNGMISRKSGTINVNQMHAYHLCLEGTAKSAAVNKDKEIRGFKTSEAIAIGDSAADFDLAPEVGAFFLLGNADKGLPEIESFLSRTENAFFIDEKMNLGWAKVAEMIARMG